VTWMDRGNCVGAPYEKRLSSRSVVGMTCSRDCKLCFTDSVGKIAAMTERQCYHCKQMVAADEPHDCWTTTEAALTNELPEDLREAWERLRDSAAELGDQRIYASHKSIMFSRRSCYVFVRPKRTFLEVCVFLDRALTTSLVRRVEPSSKSKFAHLIRVTHRDQVEAPLTDWLAEAYALAGAQPARVTRPPTNATRSTSTGTRVTREARTKKPAARKKRR